MLRFADAIDNYLQPFISDEISWQVEYLQEWIANKYIFKWFQTLTLYSVFESAILTWNVQMN